MPTGIVHILGTNDWYAPYYGNPYSIPVSQQNAHWVSINGAETTPIETPFGSGVTKYLWSEGEDCHTLVHYKRQGGGHDWPSFANQEIWDFVSQYNLDGLIDCVNDCPADVNGDASVNVSDILVAISDWGLSDSPADVNQDGTVGISDILVMIDAWGPCE